MPSEYLKYFSIGLTVFMAVVLLFGFFLGLLRGWKKSTLRFGIFVGVSVIVLLCMPLILNVTTSDITINGQTLVEAISAWIGESMPQTSEIMIGAISAATAIALAALSTIIYLVIFIIIQFVTWIIFGICKLFLRKNKSAPKRRFIGGLIGIVQGLFVCFVFMIPMAGLTDIIYKVGDTVEVAITEMKEEMTPETPEGEGASYRITFVNDSMDSNDPNGPEDNNNNELTVEQLDAALEKIKPLMQIKESYRKSMPGFIYGLGNLDVKTFEYMSVAKVDGVKYSFVKEVNTLLNFVDEALKLEDVSVIKLFTMQDENEIIEYLKKEVVIKEATETEPAVVTTRLDVLVSFAMDKLLDSNLIKNFAVEGINSITTSTVNVINDLKPEERVALGFGSTLDAEVLKLKFEDINWKSEKQKLTNILSKAVFAAFDVIQTETSNEGEGEVTPPVDESSPELNKSSLADMPLEELGEIIDLVKELDLFKKIFNPGLKRLLCIEKLVDETPENPDSGDVSGDVSNDETNVNAITIAEYVKNMTAKSLGGEGFDLKALGDYSEIDFKNLFSTVKTTLEVSERMKENGGLGVGDLSAVLAGLGNIEDGDFKDELNKTLHAVIDTQLKDTEFAGLVPDTLDIIACAPIIGSVMDVATAIGNINGEDSETAITPEAIDIVVNGINSISTSYAKLDDQNKQDIDNLVESAIDKVLGEAAGDFEVEGSIVESFAKDANMVECLLKTNFTEEKVSGKTIANAVAESGVVADLLVEVGANGIFEVAETERAVVEEALGESFAKYENLFNFVKPTPAE